MGTTSIDKKETIVFDRKKVIALAAVCLSSLMFGLEISSVPVILPTLERVLHGNFKDMQWIMNAYTIACTTVLMAAGTLADRYGRKRIFIISVFLFGLTSLVCGLAGSAVLLIASRCLQGVSGGAMLICQVAVLSQLFRDGPGRSRAFGWWGIVFGVGLGFGPIIGGMIVAVSSWQWVFLVHVVLSVVTLLLIFTGVEESGDPAAKRLDVGGMISLSLAVLGFTWFITQGGFVGGMPVAVFVVAVVSFFVFVVIERTHAHPMFDFSVFRIRSFSGAILGSMGMNFSFWPLMIYLPIYFQTGLGYDTVKAGLSLLAYTLPALVVPPLGERLVVRWRPGVVIPLGLLTIAVGFILMRLGLAGGSWLAMLPGSVVAGIGLGLTNTPVTNTTTGAVSGDRAGMASGIDMSARLITLAMNIALMGVILVDGVYSYLKRTVTGVDEVGLRRMAEEVAAGGAGRRLGPEALVHGFEGVLMYGGIGVGVLAVVSYVIFKSGRRAE